MKNLPKKIPSLLISALFIASNPSLATVINFEGAIPHGGNLVADTYDESGFTLSPSGDHLYIASRTSPTVAGIVPFINSNGDVAAGFGSNNNTSSTTITRSDQGLFSLNSLDILPLRNGDFPLPTAFSYHVTGIKSDLSSFDSAFYNIDGQWHSLSFIDNSDYQNLVQLSISATSDQPIIIAFDNINVSEVPIPATAWLFGSSFLGMASLRRKLLS